MDCVIFDIDGTLAEFDAPRLGHLVHGEVHDENAWVMGGIAPHAALIRGLVGGGRPNG